MGCCDNQLCTLMWKNYRLKRVRWKSFCCEFVIPILLVLLVGVLKSFSGTHAIPPGWSFPGVPFCTKTGAEGGTFSVPCPAPFASFLESVSPFSKFDTYISGNTPGHEFAKLFLAGEDRDGIEKFLDYMVNNGTVEGQFINFRERTFIIGSGSERELEDYVRSPIYGAPFNESFPEVAGAVIFHKMDFQTNQFDYTIRLNSSIFGPTTSVAGTSGGPLDSFEPRIFSGALHVYGGAGFMSLQNIIDTFIIDTVGETLETNAVLQGGNQSKDFNREHYLPFGVTMIAFPRPAYAIDDFFNIVGDLLPLLYIILFLVPLSQIVSAIVLEKERRTKEQLKMMGLSEVKILGSWFLTYVIYFAILALFLSLLGELQFPQTAAAGAPLSPVLFMMFFFQGLTVIAFCFLMSTFFTKAFNAVVAALSIYLVIYFIFYYVVELPRVPTFVLVFPQITYALIVQTLVNFESHGTGVSIELLSADFAEYGFTVGDGLGWLVFDFLLYACIGGYFNLVIPGELGRVLPWYFPFMPSFWKRLCSGIRCRPSSPNKISKKSAENGTFNPEESFVLDKVESFVGMPNVEEVEAAVRDQKRQGKGIQIRKLSKTFATPDGPKVAVKDFSLDVYEGQILVLLGHNGAGKTTTLQMLSGMLTPTEGEVYMYGHKLSTDLSEIRKSLGFCPQHDVLYPELTVEQHVRFYAKLKGYKGEELKSVVRNGIETVGLLAKAQVKSRALSGGMKRKLSLAIALLGNSKIVFVDEPTSGVDPWSRRNMWDIIQNHREGRVIILTTHFMDEADLLGDRIAIMAEGKLKCCGSSLYLKHLYGAGYRLTFVKGPNCDVKEVQGLVSSYIPDNDLVSDIGTELALRLPLAHSAKFPKLLRAIDDAMASERLGVEQYGISVTTLEEVFVKAGSSDDTVGANYGVEEKQVKAAAGESQVKLTVEAPKNVRWRHFKALFQKRFQYTRRDRRAFGCNTIVPLLVFTIGLLIIKFLPIGQDDPSYLLSTADLNPGYVPQNYLPVQEFRENDEQVDFGDEIVLRPEYLREYTTEDLTVDPDPPVVREVFGLMYTNGEPAEEECAEAAKHSRFCEHVPGDNLTNNAILDTGLYVMDESLQDQRKGASLYTAVSAQLKEVVLTDSCFQFGGVTATQTGIITFNYATKTCPESSCLLVEGTLNGFTQCLPAGCTSDLANTDVLELFSTSGAGAVGITLVNEGNFELFRCEGNLCNFGPAGLTDPNPCRGSPTNPDPTCIADDLIRLNILNITTDPVSVITEEDLDANYCSARNDTTVDTGPRSCLTSTALDDIELLLSFLSGQPTDLDVFNQTSGSCVNGALSCEMTVLLPNSGNGTAICSPLSCLENLEDLVTANANPLLVPLVPGLLNALPSESCTSPSQCGTVVDPGILATLFANTTAPSSGTRRILRDERRLDTRNCSATEQTCSIVEANGVCIDISCVPETQATLTDALGANAGLVVFAFLQSQPRPRGDSCDLTGCIASLDLSQNLRATDAAILALTVGNVLLDDFAPLLNLSGIDLSGIDLESLFNISDPESVQNLAALIELLAPVFEDPANPDLLLLATILGLDTDSLLVQILLSGIDPTDPSQLLFAFNQALANANQEVQCSNGIDQCVLAEFDDIPLLGTVCLANGCREEFTPFNTSFAEPQFFVCNSTLCNDGCKLPSNCESKEMTPVVFNDTEGLVDSPALCNVPPALRFSYNCFVNTTARHGGPILSNSVNNALLRFTLDSLGGNFSEAQIFVRNHPLPLTSNDQALITGFIGFTSAIFCVFAFSFVPAPMVQYVVLEKQEDRNVKHLQFVSGVSISSYWLSFFVFDLCVYMVPLAGALILVSAFDIESFTANLDAVFVVLLGYGLAVIPFSYGLSFIFKKPTSALTWSILINCFTGLILMVTSFALELIEATQDIAPTVKFALRLFPGFCLGDSLLQLSTLTIFQAFVEFGFDVPQAFDLDVTGYNILYLYLEAVLLMALVIAYEIINSKPSLLARIRLILRRLKCLKEIDADVSAEDKQVDVDVRAEQERVVSGGAGGDMLRLVNLRKVYPGGKVAVQNVTLGIPEGQCFGYLGINGAGKTSTLKCITGDVFPTSGSGTLNGFDIVTDQVHVRQHVGYCSQFSALLNRLTVREHLELFCKIKHATDIDASVDTLLNRLALKPFANKLAGSLSGGNKRKLSVAIAMIGSPLVLLLDEPSTGMDVVSKRFMWNVIEDLVSGKFNGKKTCVVLTTHSMEECEALCSRVGIMVSGRLQCLGSIQHLKSRFGTGFVIELKFQLPDRNEIEAFIQEHNLPKRIRIFKDESSSDGGPSDELVALCSRLGKNERAAALANFADSTTDSYIKDIVFAEWWKSETMHEDIVSFLEDSFEDAKLIERHDSKVKYSVPKSNDTRLSNLFETFERNKDRLRIAEYSVSQTTLEQIFNTFASRQTQEENRSRMLSLL